MKWRCSICNREFDDEELPIEFDRIVQGHKIHCVIPTSAFTVKIDTPFTTTHHVICRQCQLKVLKKLDDIKE